MNKYQIEAKRLLKKYFNMDEKKPFQPAVLNKVKTYDSMMGYIIKYWSRQMRLVGEKESFGGPKAVKLQEQLKKLDAEAKKIFDIQIKQ